MISGGREVIPSVLIRPGHKSVLLRTRWAVSWSVERWSSIHLSHMAEAICLSALRMQSSFSRSTLSLILTTVSV